MKKTLALILTGLFLITANVSAVELIIAGETVQVEGEVYEAYAAELAQMEELTKAGVCFEEEGFNNYFNIYQNICTQGVRWSGKSEITEELVAQMKEAREALVPTGVSAEDCIWYIWGDQMPNESLAETADFATAWDTAEFRPYMVPYLVEDQSAAKGNILVCSGGADRYRSDWNEGNPPCRFFNSIGYNAFLVYYRVAPYASADMTLDVQRAVRYLKAYGEEKGIGALDKIATMGYSAGAMHCYGQAIAFNGAITPDSVYPDYICDEVDGVDASITATAIIYAAGMPHDTKGAPVDIANPIMVLEEGAPNRTEELPAFFFAGASRHFASGFCVQAYQTLNPLTECELHMYGGIPGPFGLGLGYEGSDQMREQLEAFLDVQFGYRERVKE